MSHRILIVEDERIVALDLKGSLEHLGYTVVGIISQGERAVAEAQALHPDLILMDINLEGEMDGIEAARQIRERFGLPVVFLTAYAEEKTLERAELSVPYGYLLKPFELRELAATVRMAIARRNAEREVERAEHRLRLAMDAATLGVWEWERASDSFFFEGHVDSILGGAPEAFRCGRESFLAQLHEVDREVIARRLDAGEPVSMTVRMQRPDGSYGWIDLHAKAYPCDGSENCRVIGVLRDVTDKFHSEERLRQASVVFHATAEGIAILDKDRRICSVNPAFCRLTGYTAEEVLGRDPDEFLHARRHSDLFYPRLAEAEDGRWQGEMACRTKSDMVIPVWQHCCVVRDDGGEVTHYVLVFADMTAIRRAEAQIRDLAYRDPLTGLGNRHWLRERLDMELERLAHAGQKLGILFIDLDGFKVINDTLGHAAGDQLLQVIAGRIQAVLRSSDEAIRLGGDEFIVIAPEILHQEDCAILAEKLLKEVRLPVDLPKDRVRVSTSIGIAIFPDDAQDRNGLIQAADSAMYRAKARGRNRYAFFTPELVEQTRERLWIEQGLRHALEDGSLSLDYQPVVRLADGMVVGLEALMRWRHPERGAVDPGRFIPVAEDTGLIEDLGEWALREACRQGAEWLSGGIPSLRLAVNMSARQLEATDFTKRVAGILKDAGFPADRLEIEITESTIQSVGHSRDVLEELKSLGITISIDDFGTGFSSLSLLKHLPIDRVKIDRSFVRDLPADPNDVEITRAIVALARSLELSLTAEGVETLAQRDFLNSLGVEEGQGELFSLPLPPSQLSSRVTPSRCVSPSGFG